MKKNRLSAILGLLCLVSSAIGSAQPQHTISGYIKDASNGEALIGATAYVSEIANGAVSNAYGFLCPNIT